MMTSQGWNSLLLGILIAGSGIVEVQRNNAWAPIQPGETLNAGEHIRTGSGSFGAVENGPGQIITLYENTEMQIRDNNGSPLVRLESGNIKVFSATDIQVAAKDTVLQSVDRPLDMQLGLQADRINLMVLSGSVRNGSVTIHGAQEPGVRGYTADSSSLRSGSSNSTYPNFYIYPYFMQGNSGRPRPNR